MALQNSLFCGKTICHVLCSEYSQHWNETVCVNYGNKRELISPCPCLASANHPFQPSSAVALVLLDCFMSVYTCCLPRKVSQVRKRMSFVVGSLQLAQHRTGSWC